LVWLNGTPKSFYRVQLPDEENAQALEAEHSLNSTWHLLEASPLLYYSIKAALPYLEQELEKHRHLA
jgi:hypothetical protein